jgi:hypothetical protein
MGGEKRGVNKINDFDLVWKWLCQWKETDLSFRQEMYWWYIRLGRWCICTIIAAWWWRHDRCNMVLVLLLVTVLLVVNNLSCEVLIAELCNFLMSCLQCRSSWYFIFCLFVKHYTSFVAIICFNKWYIRWHF